jgi:hypothetical protein
MINAESMLTSHGMLTINYAIVPTHAFHLTSSSVIFAFKIR